MVKSREVAERRMREAVSTAAARIREGMEEAVDPLDVLTKNPEAFAKALVDGLVDAIKRGKWQTAIATAKKRDAWKNSQERAGRHYEERAEDMVAHAMEDYEVRKKCIEEAQKAIEGMPKATRAQRIARSAKYQEVMGNCMDRAKGRKG